MFIKYHDPDKTNSFFNLEELYLRFSATAVVLI